MPDDALVARASEIVQALSKSPRFAGSRNEAEARALCAKELERAGLSCVERPFDYSQWPGRWGIPTAAAVQLATILIVARTAMMRGPLVALIVGAALYIALISASADAKRRWVQVFPFMRASSTNLEARRGDPRVWLVAHLDSKSQTIPMLIRIASAVALGIVTAVTTLLLLLSIFDRVEGGPVWSAIQIAALIAALPSMLCLIRNNSPGAVDNASGVASVLLAAHRLASAPSVGVLITSGEELGLAGARVWAQGADAGSVFLNCDTIDDAGGWRLMYTGARPNRVAEGAQAASSALRLELRLGRMIPGILADSMAFADKGMEAVTVSRGTISTLARIHTRRDNSTALSGRGIADASAILTALTRELS